MNYLLSETAVSQRLSLPYEAKLKRTIRLIEDYISYYGVSGTYVSFSGGIDSTVLLHLVRSVEPSVKGVFINTTMEDPRIREYVFSHDNIESLHPTMRLKDIIAAYGWCWPSKDVSEALYYARQGKQWAINKLNGLDKDGNYSEYRQQYKKFRVCLDWDMEFSPYCCIKQKEEPVMEYEKKFDVHPFFGLRAGESARRRDAYRKTGCNSFDVRKVFNQETGEYVEEKVSRPVSKPLSIWSDQDTLRYLVEHDIDPAAPYGWIYEKGTVPGQLSFFGANSCGKLACSGDKRTGCMFCPIGCHLDNFAKFKGVRKYNRKLYDYCMEELGEKKLLEKIQSEFGGNLYCD